MHRRSIIVTIALVMGIALGIIFGPTLRASVTSAQTASPTPAQGTSARESLWNLFLDNLATRLNIQRSALDTAIVDAGTASADQAVQQGTLTQAQADALKGRLQAGDLGSIFGGRGKGLRGMNHLGVRQAILDAAASQLNITRDELITQLRGGQTLAQLAQAQGTTEQAVIDAGLAAARTQLNQAVSNGTLTQEQADEIYTRLEQQGAQLFSHPQRGGRAGRHGWPGGSETLPAPATTPSTDA